MAVKRSGKRKKTATSRNKKKNNTLSNLVRVGIGLCALIGVVVVVLGLMHYFLPDQAPVKVPVKKAAAPKAPAKIPTYEVYPKEKPPQKIIVPKPTPGPAPVPEPAPRPGKELPRVVIIIDDVGYDQAIAEKFLSLNEPITLSVFPNGPFSRKIAARAREKGMEIMLHLPMEPKEYPVVHPGPEALLTGMGPDERIALLEKHILAIPGIKGVNNHMGSKMTVDADQMNQIFSVLKSKDLFFIDSLTAPESVGKSSARLFKLPFAERDVFIDHVEDPEFVSDQIERLIRIAEKHGSSVGIGHPHEVTFKTLNRMMPELKKRVTIVPASELVYLPG